MERVNLGKLVSKALHVPNIDGYPVYGRVDMELEGRSKAWYRATKDSNNSPSNIRRVYITLEGVLISFYSSVGNLGRNTFIRYDRSIGESVGRSDIEYTSHVLKSFDSEWVLSNLEELYVDSSILLNSGVTVGDNITRESIGGILTSYLDTSKYTRLKVIGYISNLKDILQVYNISDYNDINKHWYDSLVGDKVSGVILYKFNGDRYDLDFTCKSGVYTYDRDNLEDRFSRYRERLKGAYKEYSGLGDNKKGDVSEGNNRGSSEDILSLLRGLENITNTKVLGIYIDCLSIGLSQVERLELLDKLIGSSGDKLRDNLIKVKENR